MALRWLSVHLTLWSTMCSFTANVKASPCAEVRTPSAVVLSGSPVTASCYIKEDCPLTKSQDFHVEWPYAANLSYRSVTSHEERTYEILISNFTNMAVMLECAVCIREDCNVVAGMKIKAAYPPPAPRNLTCQLNLAEPCTLLCTWDPGQENLNIPTNYSLHTEIRDSSEKFVYVPAPGRHFYTIPRVGFALFNEVQVHVVAQNALGAATSEPLVLDPMETAKLDAPEIQTVGTENHGCLGHKWSLSEAQKWITSTLFVEIRMKPMSNKALDREQVIFKKRRPGNIIEVCKLLHGMMYQSEMRVRYHSSPWSEWSHPIKATTGMRAPTGRLVTWLKLLGQPANRQYQAELFWKPSLQFRANSMNVSYVVSFERPPGKTLCITNQQYCSFPIPVDIKKIHLTAMNEAGKSSPTNVTVYKWKGRDQVPYLNVFPESEESMIAKWSSPESSAISAYVLEWKALHGDNFTTVSFEILNRNQSSMEVPGLEPYKPYEFSVYPKYKDGIGQPCTVMAYTKQKAPSESPKLNFGEIRPSYVELFWDEIPLQKRNGIITGYTVFYCDEKNNTGVAEAKVKERWVVLKDLNPHSIYNIHLMASTIGGSLNGSVVTVKTPSIDAFEIVLIVIPACVGLALLFLGVFTCFSNNKHLKKCLWPMIPDPANSSIKKWSLSDSLQDISPLKEVKDPVPVHLSHFSLLSLSEKELWKENTSTSEYPHCGKWTYNGKSVHEEHSDSSRDSGIYNSGSQSESVPYATVVFANPYRCHPAPLPAYLRSESTQPLLAEEEPSSPLTCEKMSTHMKVYEVDHFSALQEDSRREEVKGSLWKDFPMLQSLEISDINKQT
ncbi:granulocyte colony-stimulating factor receptor [Salminus brasiliensis]|uniref:granulocyte colony-stimulating factor receptor n=1 Tax=Salminus brasiliensis TaxID=930266 RepID=UPI003B83447C